MFTASAHAPAATQASIAAARRMARGVLDVPDMPRKLDIEVVATAGAIDECVIWVNHHLVVDQAPKATWSGKIPSGTTPITVECGGIGTSSYHVKVAVDGAVVTDVDRDLQGGIDVFKKSV
jgi:hypothetical protein